MRTVILLSLALCGCDGVFKLVEVRDPAPADASELIDAPILVPDGLVAHYPFDDALLVDVIGGNDGTCDTSQCPVVTPGVVGAALLFDGNAQHVRVSTTTALITTSGFTVAAWVRLDVLEGSSCPMSKQYADSHYNTYQLCALDNRDLRFYTYDGVQPHDLPGPKLPVTEWHHVAMRYDGQNKSIVLDGVVSAEIAAPVMFDSSAITFGADIDGSQIVGGFGGAIDEVRIYNRALTAAELRMLATPPL